MLGAVHVRVSRVHGLSSADATVCVPAMGGRATGAGAFGSEMGSSKRHGFIPDAARRFAAYSNVAGPSLKRFALDSRGATAIEYAIIASLISIVIVGGAASIGTSLKDFFNSVKFGG